ncbi:glycosyltransferase [Tropicimonas marinistellae]|uniref:glycosyltransferase n=1 Tax=Tropicimonas marinistellae TaxID=1739787 RepID=UPI000834D5F7|nr:glycosyltransferase [Tropicimonas marinistellae]
MDERNPEMTPRIDGAPAVSVVIPCKGNPEALVWLLRDVLAQALDRSFEVIVVDAWSDDTIKAAAEAEGARVVRQGSGHLPGAARNLGANAAQGEVLVFVDADCRVQPGWLAAAVATLESGARLATGPVADLTPRHPIARADNLLQFADLPPERPAGTLHMAPSCNIAIHAEDFANLGGFQHREGLATGEDVDFCERLTALWPEGIRFNPQMQVRHAGRRTIAGMIRHHHAFGYSRGKLRLLLTDRQVRLAGMAVMAPAVVLRRLIYIFGRVTALSPLKLPATALVSPFLLIGAAAWTVGFRKGLHEVDPPPRQGKASVMHGNLNK